ncbi:unnamed protein product [Brassica rapa subsp. narinosa]
MKRGSYSSFLSSYGGASFHRRRRRSGVTSAAHSVASASERRDFSCHGRSCVRRKEDGDGNSNTGSCTDHIPEINIILLPAKTETHMKNMIQVSSTKKSLFFYVNLAPSLVDLVLIPERSLAFICPPNCLFVFQIEQFENVF